MSALAFLPNPSKHTKVGHYRPTSKTPFEWRFAGGPIVARFCMLTGVSRNDASNDEKFTKQEKLTASKNLGKIDD